MNAAKNWRTQPLARIARLTMGQSPESKYYSDDDSCRPFLQGCAEFGKRIPSPALYCTQARKIGKAGSILFSVRAPVGRINIADQDYVIGRGLAAIEGIEIDHSYLEQYLTFVNPAFRNASQGSTFEAINSSELSLWPIYLPESKPEQTKIAEILSTVDRAIEQAEALIAKQQRLKTGLMQDLLTRGIDEHGNLRSEQTHKFKDSPLGRIPVEWEVNMLGEIAEVRGGKRLPAGHSYSSADTGHRYFRVTDFYRKEIDYFSLEMLEEVTFRALRRYEIKQGDLCVSIAGSLGYFAHYLPPSEFQTILTENAARIVPKTGFIPSLLCSILNSDRVQMQIEEEKGVGGGVPKLALFRIRSLHVPLPSCENEQSRILGSLASQSEAFTATIIALSKLHSLKTALMQDLLTGRKMVTTLLDGKEAIE